MYSGGTVTGRKYKRIYPDYQPDTDDYAEYKHLKQGRSARSTSSSHGMR